jgi:serine/threonine protein kinase
LKPANILIDRCGRRKIADFGSSKFIEGSISISKEFRGTFCYQAPEMYDDDPYTSKIDIFSFALIPYEILAGSPVFPSGLRAEQIMRRVCDGIRTEFPSDMNSDMKSLITRCWKENSEDRPPFSEIRSELWRIRFNIPSGVDSDTVDQFRSQVAAAAV